jgi:cytochrome b
MRAGPEPTVETWDRVVRVLHWSLAASVAGGWITTWWFGGLHQRVGWLALALVLLRLAWGGLGGPHARFSSFVRSPRATWAYLRLLLRRREPRYIGHNPLGGWMVIALLACVIGLAVTGWLYTTDWFWGDELVERIHTTLAWSVVVLVVLHVAGVLFTGRRHRENLVRAMIDGRKRRPGVDDIG